ncbi:hypothetical protein BofuT4_P066230.1 [Botrytis cinerea T4]|uniref:Uncharacterized protein n=1 Tax=Botryotinia fuckeliana (strain T4) TaxID=999810 RepID=G2XRU8_BOTF4|nr:hypothetical protein BofuT4_P066230.1 [Botrytis cinerea T4]
MSGKVATTTQNSRRSIFPPFLDFSPKLLSSNFRCLSTFAAYKHTSLAFSELFPKIDRGFGSSELLTAFSTKSNFLQVGASWALIGMLIFSPQLENKVRFGKLPKLLHKGFIIGRWHMAEASNGNSPAQVGQVWLEYWL